jgi:uncharacterized delta-60 repeat protein
VSRLAHSRGCGWRLSSIAPVSFALALLAALFTPTLAQAAKSGDLDRSFGKDGIATTGIRGGVKGRSVAVDSHDRIVVAGGPVPFANPSDDFVLTRYTQDGSLDRSFGGDGTVRTDFGHSETAEGVAVDSPDRVIAVGESWNGTGPHAPDAVLARYQPDGQLDPAFGGDGRVRTLIGYQSGANAVAVDAQGRIVIAGWSFRQTPPYDEFFTIARYETDGSLDPSFGTGGKVRTSFGIPGQWDSSALAVAIDSQGRIVATGVSEASDGSERSRSAMARFRPNGALDTSFSGNGKLTPPTGGGLAIDSQDRIMVSGARGTQPDLDFALFRYTDGTRDRSFGAHGTVRTDFRGGDDYSSAVAIDPRGRIVAGGAGGRGFALARYKADGSLDPSFSRNGKVTIDVGRSASSPWRRVGASFPDGLALDSQDRIIAAGTARDPRGFAVARFIGYPRHR